MFTSAQWSYVTGLAVGWSMGLYAGWIDWKLMRHA